MPSTRTMASYRLEILPWCSALITASSTSTCTCTTCSRHNTAEAEISDHPNQKVYESAFYAAATSNNCWYVASLLPWHSTNPRLLKRPK